MIFLIISGQLIIIFIIYHLKLLMSNTQKPPNSLPIMQYLHLNTLIYIFKLFRQDPNQPTRFPTPQLDLFRRIPHYYTDISDRYKLFKNLLLCYRWQISVGVLLTVIFSSLNLLLSQIIKQFMETMQSTIDRRTSSSVAFKFIVLQLLRLIFRAHMKKTFRQLAIMVESALSKRLVKKALMMDHEQRKRIPETQVFQLQNVDLRLIYNLFSNLYLAVQIPFTIGVAIIWLFLLNAYLGLIALYWFGVIFLVQRLLDDCMHHCNITKLRLIQSRSKLNYEFMQKITEARLIRAESMLVERNNDYFLEQNHDHIQFYRYASLYDIAQLLLPIAVVVTASLLDQNSQQPLTVQQLYLILSLLGICYRPMKDFRTLSISLNDGFHSLRRITDYLQKQDEKPKGQEYMRVVQKSASINVARGTIADLKTNGSIFKLCINFHIEMKAGQRHVVLGRKGQGSTTFLNTLMGQVTISTGRIITNGKIAYLSSENFFLIDSLYSNLTFFNKSISDKKVKEVFDSLGLNDQLRLSKGLDEIIEENKFNENQLKLMSLGRVFCSAADIYVLDCPFSGLSIEAAARVQKMLRKKQDQGVLIVLALQKTDNILDADNVIILSAGVTKQMGSFKQLCANRKSYIQHFIKKQPVTVSNETAERIRSIALEFQTKVKKALMYSALFQKESEEREKTRKMQYVMNCVANYSASLTSQYQQRKLKEAQERQKASVGGYFLKFIKSFPFSESLYILFIIISVQVLHIFIHFYIGHEYQHHAKEGVKAIRRLMFYEGVLTLGLCGLIYLEGEVSSYLAVIAGNRLYKQSLQSLVHKELRWYGQEYFLRTANKFNHDYEQIFIIFHGVLSLYKNVIILISTALFVGGNHPLVMLISILVAFIYFGIFLILRKVHSCILKHHSDYKYQFVKVFNQSIQGASFIKIYGVTNQVIQKGKEKYLKLAQYKLAVSYVTLGQSLLCDLASTFITAAALDYGTDIKLASKTDIAVVATSILLLLNLADVFKAILDAAIQVQTFFKLNILPFMQIAPLQSKNFKQTYPPVPKEFGIYIQNAIFKQNDQEVFQIYPLKLRIDYGERVCIYEQDQNLRDNLLFGLTKNLNSLANPTAIQNTAFIGGIPICQLSSQSIRDLIGVIINQNFFLSGTLRDNLKWRTPNFNQKKVLKLAQELQLGRTLKGFNQNGLQTRILQTDEQFSEVLSKKLTVLRVIIRCPKIVIIKDTVPFVDKWSVVDLLDKYNPGCTIIKITNTLQVAYDMNRIIYLEHLKVVEDGQINKFMNDHLSKTGQMLRNCNTQGYVYRNKVSGYKKVSAIGHSSHSRNSHISDILHSKKV